MHGHTILKIGYIQLVSTLFAHNLVGGFLSKRISITIWSESFMSKNCSLHLFKLDRFCCAFAGDHFERNWWVWNACDTAGQREIALHQKCEQYYTSRWTKNTYHTVSAFSSASGNHKARYGCCFLFVKNYIFCPRVWTLIGNERL